MSFNKLPVEIIEQILNEVSLMDWSTKKYAIQRCALVCQQWRLIADRIYWKEIDISRRYNHTKEFKFYKYITNPENDKGLYIRKLKMNSVKLWPICIGKILQVCPNIVELEIKGYKYNNDTQGYMNLLEFIPKALPKLRIINLERSGKAFKKIDIIKFVHDYESRINIKISV